MDEKEVQIVISVPDAPTRACWVAKPVTMVPMTVIKTHPVAALFCLKA
jgi:hypothetical protein